MPRLFLALVLLCSAPLAASACPGCKEPLDEKSDQQDVASAFHYSIYGMLILPFLLTGGIVLMIIRSDRQRAARAVDAPPQA